MSPSSSVLSQPALVLNRSWTAVATTTVRHALGLMFKGSAMAIRPETYEVHGFESWADLAVPHGEPCVKAVSLSLRVPEVIVLTHYNSIPDTAVVFSRRNLYKRDRNTCQYCGARPGTAELSIDHVTPRSRGGRTSWQNCVLACVACNRRKANRLPREVGMHLIKDPVPPKWTPMLELPLGRVRQSWERFVSDHYWDVQLETD